MISATCRRTHRSACQRCLSTLRPVHHSHQHADADGTTNLDTPSSMGLNDDVSSDEAQEPWKTLLEMPARSAWRVSDPTPPNILDHAQRQVFHRTKGHYNQTLKHLKQIHESVIESHKALALRRHRERMRTLHAKEPTKAEERRESKQQPVFYGPEETLAALKFRLYPNFSVVKRVLLEAKSLLAPTKQESVGEQWRPKHVLDFGIGCASASAAVLNVWEHEVEWIHGVDPSEAMRTGAQAILEAYSQQMGREHANNSSPRLTLAAHLSSEIAPPSFDLALFTHTATELPHGSSILAAAAILWDKLRPNGLFVMIEPGTPDGFSSVRMVRNMLLDCVNSASEDEETCRIIAPCTHNGPCPMELYPTNPKAFTQVDVTDNDGDEAVSDDGEGGKREFISSSTQKGFCSFVQTMPGPGGTAKGEKFCYLVAQKRVKGSTSPDEPDQLGGIVKVFRQGITGSPDESAEAHGRAMEMEAVYLDSDLDDLGLEVVRGDANRASFGRIVRSPLKKKGHIHIDCCVSPGRIERQIVSKSLSKRVPGAYGAARKARWGGFWPAEVVSIDTTK